MTIILILLLKASSILECLRLYDQLVPLTPLLSAMTAASPAYNGFLIGCEIFVLVPEVAYFVISDSRNLSPPPLQKMVHKIPYLDSRIQMRKFLVLEIQQVFEIPQRKQNNVFIFLVKETRTGTIFF